MVTSGKASGWKPNRRTFLKSSAGGIAGGLFAPALIGRANAATVVHLASIQSLTGPSSPIGTRGRDGAELAINQINKAGGFTDAKGNAYTISVVNEDFGNDPKQAVTLFRQQASDTSILAIMGPTNSVGFLPSIPMAKQFEILAISNGSGAPVKEWNPWAYRVNPTSVTAVPILLKKTRSAIGFKRLSVIYDQTQDAQFGDAKACQALQSEYGYEVVSFDAFRSKEQDFSPQIAKLKNASPDAIYVAASTGDGIKVVSQIRSLGLAQPVITGFGQFTDPVYWSGSAGGIMGGYTWISVDLKGAKGKLGDWIAEYNKTFPLPAINESVFAYDAVHAIVESVRIAGRAERGAIREVMSHLNHVTSLETHIKFQNPPHGDNLSPVVTVVKITGSGKYDIVA